MTLDYDQNDVETEAEEEKNEQQQQQQQKYLKRTKPRSGGVAADASFLERLGQNQSELVTTTSTSALASASTSTSTTNNSVLELHRSNLLRLQAEQLLEEVKIHGGLGLEGTTTATDFAGASKRRGPPRWTAGIGPYVDVLAKLLEATNRSLARLAMDTASKERDFLISTCPFVMQSDNSPQRCLESIADHAKKIADEPFIHVRSFVPPALVHAHQHHHLHHHGSAAGAAGVLHVVGSAGSCGLTKASGNANVLPTFDLVVQLSNSLWDAKDYMKHRYFDKRKLIVWHIAQQLTRINSNNGNTKNKHDNNSVGTVYWTYGACHDVRKPCLILIPSGVRNAISKSNKNSSNKKAKHPHSTNTSAGSDDKKYRPKFRIRICFEMESIEWIPLLRLVPNRSNLPHVQTRETKTDGNNDNDNDNDDATITGSPMYNHALLEDAYHSCFLPTAKHSAHAHRKRIVDEENIPDDDCDDDDNSDDDEEEHYPHWIDSIILAKIWCLQRGLLRAHDGFTTEHLAILILYLYRTKKANARLAPLQVLSSLLKFLADTQWFFGTKGTTATTSTTATDDQANNKNLLRQAPSVASSFYCKTSMERKCRRKHRAALILPSRGRTEAQTADRSHIAKLYAKQTRESPLTPHDPGTLLELYRETFPGPILLDSSLRFNYLQRLSPAFMSIVQNEATRSLHYLHSPSLSIGTQATALVADKPFSALFMTAARFWNRHDLYFQIPLSRFRKEAETQTCLAHYSTNCRADMGEYEALSRAVVAILCQALGDRVTSVQVLSTGNGMLDSNGEESHVDTDELPLYLINRGRSENMPAKAHLSPRGDGRIVLGVSLNTDTCHRIVDRGPPADEPASIQHFLDLWGEKAELRRFKDGAIVQAVVWNSTKNEPGMDTDFVRYQNEDAMQGGIAERIVNLMLHRHFLSNSNGKSEGMILSSPLRHMISIIDGTVINGTANDKSPSNTWFSNPTLAHRSLMKASEELSGFLKEHSLPTLPVPGTVEGKMSRLGLPLAIDAVEPLSPCLRYSDLFPPLPHLFLGSNGVKGLKKTSGVISTEPVCIQIRCGASSKWPTDLKAIGAAKAAMLIQLAKGIEEMHSASPEECEGFAIDSIIVTPNYVDLGFRGYMFRIKIRADPEIRLLRGIFRPSTEAEALLRELTQEHVVAAMHHSMIHAVHTKHASAGGVVRLATRWFAGHMLSGLVPNEAIELIVCQVYTNRNSPLEAPGTVAAGFLRFLELLQNHDWVREPFIVDPFGHINEEDRSAITARFEKLRGPNREGGSPMYIITPNDRGGLEDLNKVVSPSNDPGVWSPSYTANSPEWVVLTRIIALARKSRFFLLSKLSSFDMDSSSWSTVFCETTQSYHGYSALLRVHPEFTTNEQLSSTCGDLGPELRVVAGTSDVAKRMVSAYTKCMEDQYLGPKALRMKVYRNMRNTDEEQVLSDWRPVTEMVEALRRDFGSLALFFYNYLCPDVIAVLWRPHVFSTQPFSVMTSEYTRPSVSGDWKADTMVMINVDDVFREMSQLMDGIVLKVKLFQSPEPASSGTIVSAVSVTPSSAEKKRKRAASAQLNPRDNSAPLWSSDSDNDSE